MGIKKRKYSKEQKEEIVQRALSGERILALGKENNISPGLINRWKRQYLDGELSNNADQEVKKLETQVAKLEQMIGKLTIYDALEGKTLAYTQFSRAMQELSVGMVYACSPQAKGRIERFWETLQDRLVLELRLAGIKSIKEANAFLPGFIKRFNVRFAVVPREPQSAYRSLEKHINIDYILCRKEARKASQGSTFSFGGQTYQLSKNNQIVPLPNKAVITVLTSPRFDIRAEYMGGVYQVRKTVRSAKVIAKKDKVKRFIKVKDDHPWKNGVEHFTYEESDRELVAAIYDPKGWE